MSLKIAVRRFTSAGALALAAAAAILIAVMMSASVVWALRGADRVRVAPAQTRLLNQYDPAVRPHGVIYRPFRVAPASEVPAALLIPTSQRPPGVRGAAPLFFTASAPAGRYRLEAGGPMQGTLVVRTGRSISPLYRVELGGASLPEFLLPTDVAGLVIDIESGNSSGIRSLWLQPVSVIPPGERLTDAVAWQSGRYGPAAVFGLDHRSYFEPPGIWTRGGVDTSVVVHPDAPGPFRLFLRNGPVNNEVDLATAEWRQTIAMEPGRELEVKVPRGTAVATLLRIRTSSGFRPHDVDPTSADVRYLGVWMEIR